MNATNRIYECLYIIDSTLTDEQVESIVSKYSQVVTDQGGELQAAGKWDKRRLAYEISGRREGIYILMYFNGEPAVSEELDRLFRIADDVFRHIIVRVEAEHIDTSRIDHPQPSAEAVAEVPAEKVAEETTEAAEQVEVAEAPAAEEAAAEPAEQAAEVPAEEAAEELAETTAEESPEEPAIEPADEAVEEVSEATAETESVEEAASSEAPPVEETPQETESEEPNTEPGKDSE